MNTKAGIGSRVLNCLIDTLLIWLLSYALYRFWLFHVLYWHYRFVPYYLFFYATLCIYYFLFEAFFLRTPSKWITMTKVKSTRNQRPSIFQLLIRSIARLTIIDCFFFPFLNECTLHDYLSSTEVVTIE